MEECGVVVVDNGRLISGGIMSLKIGRAAVHTVTTVRNKEYVAMSIPCERSVERHNLPVVVSEIQVCVVQHLHKLVGSVRSDDIIRERTLGNVGHINVDTREVRTIVGCRVRGFETKVRDVASERSQLSRVDNHLAVAVVVAAVADRSIRGSIGR